MNTFVPKQIDGKNPHTKNVTSFSNKTSVKFRGNSSSHNNNPFPFIIHKGMKLSFWPITGFDALPK